jgi:heme/copper-type cytochrome/quinol oxidase subunit 4
MGIVQVATAEENLWETRSAPNSEMNPLVRCAGGAVNARPAAAREKSKLAARGSAGIFTCIVIAIVGMGSYFFFNIDFGLPGSPLVAMFGVIIYGVLANVCFTGGWVAELIVQRIWPEEANQFASTSFSLGLVFSVLLTLTPAVLIGVGGSFGLASHLLGVIRQ